MARLIGLVQFYNLVLFSKYVRASCCHSWE